MNKLNHSSNCLVTAVGQTTIGRSGLRQMLRLLFLALVLLAVALPRDASASWLSSKVAPVVNKVAAVVKKVTPTLNLIPGMAPITTAINQGAEIFAGFFPPKNAPPVVVGQPYMPPLPSISGPNDIRTMDVVQDTKISLDNQGTVVGNQFSVQGTSLQLLKMGQHNNVGHATVREGGALTLNTAALDGVQGTSVQIDQTVLGKSLEVGSQATVIGNRANLTGRLSDTKLTQSTDFGTLNTSRGTTIGNDFNIAPTRQVYRAF